MAVVQFDREDHQPENGFVSPESTSPGLLAHVDQTVLPCLGGFGKYQKQLIVLTWIPALFIGFSQYSDSFLLAQPNNTCVQPLVNLTNQTTKHSTLVDHPKNTGAQVSYMYANGSYGTSNDTASMQCGCNEWTFELHTGLVQNVVTKVSCPSRHPFPSHRVMHIGTCTTCLYHSHMWFIKNILLLAVFLNSLSFLHNDHLFKCCMDSYSHKLVLKK